MITLLGWFLLAQSPVPETGAIWFRPRPVTIQRVVRAFADGRTTDGAATIGNEQTTDFFAMMTELCSIPEAYPVCVKWIQNIQINGQIVWPKPVPTLPGTGAPK